MGLSIPCGNEWHTNLKPNVTYFFLPRTQRTHRRIQRYETISITKSHIIFGVRGYTFHHTMFYPWQVIQYVTSNNKWQMA